MGIEYVYAVGKKTCKEHPLPVKLDGKLVGEIREVKDGFQYFPKGQKTGGEVFAKVSAVQNSLLSLQPTKAERAEGDSDVAPEDIVRQAKAGMKKLEKDLRESEMRNERSAELLQAISILLARQAEGDDTRPISILEDQVCFEGIECDGHTIAENIAQHLGLTD